jgi:hypothetical protein
LVTSSAKDSVAGRSASLSLLRRMICKARHVNTSPTRNTSTSWQQVNDQKAWSRIRGRREARTQTAYACWPTSPSCRSACTRSERRHWYIIRPRGHADDGSVVALVAADDERVNSVRLQVAEPHQPSWRGARLAASPAAVGTISGSLQAIARTRRLPGANGQHLADQFNESCRKPGIHLSFLSPIRDFARGVTPGPTMHRESAIEHCTLIFR